MGDIQEAAAGPLVVDVSGHAQLLLVTLENVS